MVYHNRNFVHWCSLLVDRCREQFLTKEGPFHLNNLLKQCIAFATVHEYTKLKTVTCGWLLNICCQNGMEKYTHSNIYFSFWTSTWSVVLCCAILSEAMFALDIVKSLSLLISKEEDDRVLCMAFQTMAVLLEQVSLKVNVPLNWYICKLCYWCQWFVPF